MQFFGVLVAFVLMSVGLTAPAAAIVYRGFQSAGPGGSGTITARTDGTIGALSASNIVSFAASSTINGISRDSVSGGPGSDTTLIGSGLSATATGLIFDFGSDGFFGIADFEPGNTGFCVDGVLNTITCAGDPPSLSFFASLPGNEFVSIGERRTGVQLLASAIPEPATWLFLTFGMGVVGAAMRRNGVVAAPARHRRSCVRAKL